MITTALQVALVESDPALADTIEQILLVSGYDTCVFSSAEEFLSRQDTQQIDCLVVEVDLPGMSGIDLRKRLSMQGKTMPVIFITTEEVPESFGRLFHARFLHKPFRGHRLVSSIRAAINVD